MVFKGRGLTDRIEILGGELNAFTDREIVAFEVKSVYSKMPKILPYFLDMIFGPTFPSDELTQERKVVIQEIKEDLNDHEILAYLSGKMKMFHIKILPGDRVSIEMTPYDLTKGRITYRQKGGQSPMGQVGGQ